MAKRSSIVKQERREKLVNLNREKRKGFKDIVKSLDSTYEERMTAQDKLNKMSPNTSAVRLRNRCQLTGRPRGFLKKFGVSRIAFRELASRGLVPGVQKSSW